VPSHPYISGAGNIAQMIGFLRKTFPTTVNSQTVKKFSLAPNNESYVINALQFIGIIDQEGQRTDKGHDIFVLNDDDFPGAFEGLIRDSYKDLFDLRGEDAWTMTKPQLISYFRTTDKTGETVGARQAAVFMTFRGLAGHAQPLDTEVTKTTAKQKQAKPKITKSKGSKVVDGAPANGATVNINNADSRRDMALTVRIEINLPANGSKETYDNIFKSIRANLINE
jgi:hypothetical protein